MTVLRYRTVMALMLLWGSALTLIAIACGDEDEKPLEKVVFMAGFKPQANLPFLAAYVAQEKGFFGEQNLEVEIQHATTGGSSKFLMAGDVDITTADAAAVLKRRSDPGLPLVALALFGQRGQQAFVALKESGLVDPKDWEGKTFGYKTSVPPDYLAIVKANGVDRGKISEVRVGFDPRILTEGQVDILAVFKSNEPDTIRKLGFDVSLWDPADYGLPSMGLTYITREELVQEESDKIERWLKAALKGLQYAFDNREEAVDIVLQYAPKEDREHQKFMMETEMADAVSPLTQERGLGWMTDAQWKALYDQLLESEALPNPFDYRAAYTDQYLTTMYDGNELDWP